MADRMAKDQRLQLTPRQQELLGWFDRNAPSLREPYEAAIRLLSDPSFPARVHLIAHLVRDIANRLPDVIEGTTSKRLDYANMLDGIAQRWQKHFYPKTDYSDTQAPSTHVSGPLPSQLFKGLHKLVTLHLNSRNRPRPEERLFRSEMLAEVESPELLRPMEKQFHELHEWFRAKAHLSNEVGEPVAEHELIHKFECFERVLLGVKGQFFRAIGELDEIIQDTNN